MKLLQKEVAGILGVDTNTTTNWEKNRCQPRLQLFPRILQFLGYDPALVDAITLGEKVVQYRKSIGVSQKELARKIGIDPRTLSRLERNRGGTDPGMVRKVNVLLASINNSSAKSKNQKTNRRN